MLLVLLAGCGSSTSAASYRSQSDTDTGTTTGSTQQRAFYFNVAFITGPLIEAEVDAFNIGTPFPEPELATLVATVATRAANG